MLLINDSPWHFARSNIFYVNKTSFSITIDCVSNIVFRQFQWKMAIPLQVELYLNIGLSSQTLWSIFWYKLSYNYIILSDIRFTGWPQTPCKYFCHIFLTSNWVENVISTRFCHCKNIDKKSIMAISSVPRLF